MPFEFKAKSCRSWLHHTFGRVLSQQLSKRLIDRCRGEQGLFLTFTYDRADYEDAADLYRRCRDERHVRRFIDRLERWLGESLRGRWLCKLEFQKGGWVHFHLVILGVTFVPHDILVETWAHGHVWVRRLTAHNIRYTCKYISKDAALPAFLFLEPSRSVRIVRASPGFWLDTEPGNPGDRPPKRQRLDAYVPIGELIERAEDETVVRDDRGRYASIRMPVIEVGRWARVLGGYFERGRRGWLTCLGVSMGRVERRARQAARPPGPPLHSINGGDPPSISCRRFLNAYFIERFSRLQEIQA